MSSPPDRRSRARSDARTTPARAAVSYQDMVEMWTRRRIPRILVVDDQPSVAGLMSQLLALRGYEVVTAANAAEAEAEIGGSLPI